MFEWQTQSQSQSYNVGKKISYPKLLVLSKPLLQELTYKKMTCPAGHTINLVRIFALDEKYCPVCSQRYDEKEKPTEKLDIYSFMARDMNDEKIEVFSTKPVDIDIYNTISIEEGNEVSVASKNKGVFRKGILVNKGSINKFVENKTIQKSFLTKEKAIEEFMSNRPIPNYPKEIYDAWKHAWFLSMVKSDINILTIAEAGFGKTEAALQSKEITDGAYIDTPNSSAIAIIGSAIKDISGSYHFEGGAIFQAKNNLLIVDEVEKMQDYNYLRQVNTLLANHTFTYRKANIFYEDNDFHISFFGLGNPNTRGMLFNGMPKFIIDNTFSHNPEFLSRMHLIFAFRNKGSDTSHIKKVNMESLKGFVNHARSIIVKEPSKDIAGKISELAKEYASKTNDSRAYVKAINLCEAEAKLNLSDVITEREIEEVRNLLNISIKLLYSNS